MLKSLEIKNYALIRELSFTPSESFNALTGETGSGKSILLGALGLLMGNRADTTVLLEKDIKCIVEGIWSIENYHLESLFEELDLDHEKETVVRREIIPSGKSRAFVNDTPVTLDSLKKIMNQLMDIHSQHDNLQLGNSEFQRYVVDTFGVKDSFIESYQTSYKQYRSDKKELEELESKKESAGFAYEFNQKQLEELEDANLDVEEWNEIKKELSIAQNVQQVSELGEQIIQIGTESEFSVSSGMQQILDNLKTLSEFSEDYQSLASRFESASIEIDDILTEVARSQGAMEFDESRILYIQEKSDLINGLFYKHKVDTIEELLEKKETLQKEVDAVENYDGLLSEYRKKMLRSLEEVQKFGVQLLKERQKSGTEFSSRLSGILSELGMENNVIKVDIQEAEPHENGCDAIEILFSANKGVDPKPLKKVASGGEFSRLLFGIKHILAEKATLPTIIFDEIDTGISGNIARKMGAMMHSMGKYHQVISITHLPQVASLASRHFKVSKDESGKTTETHITELNEEGRIFEIAQMLSGNNPSDVAYLNAKELLSLDA